MKRFLPTKNRQKKHYKLAQRQAKWCRSAKRDQLRMNKINHRILFRMMENRERNRVLEAWEREQADLLLVDTGPTAPEPATVYAAATTAWYPTDISVTASTTVRGGW